MADTTTKTLRLAIISDTATAEKAFANLNKEIKNTGISVTGFTTTITKNAEGMDVYAHSVALASTSLKELEKTQKSIRGSSQQGPVTSNALKDAQDLERSKLDLVTKSSAEMVAKAKAAITAQLIVIREGENSIAAVKNSSAERQKQIETNLQEKLKSIRDRYAAGEFNKGSLDLSIKAITDAYTRQTVALSTEVDRRIAKIKEETAAQQEAARVARLSIAQRLGEAQVYTPRSDASIALTRGMTQAGLAARPVAQTPLPPIPKIPDDIKNGYDSLFARIGAINIEYRLWNTAINTVINSLRAVPKIGIELESTKAALTASMGESGAVITMEALKKEADRTGMSINALRESFRNFSASTLLSGQGLESTWKMFQNINTTATALHFSTDQVNHTFLALSQIFNKSKVQSEELVKQLGNLLPGAFAAFQKANEDLYSSPKKLSEAMKQGLVTASETVEKFTTYYAERFAVAFQGASEGLNANINRMNNSFTSLGEAIYGVTGGSMNAFVKSVTDVTKYLEAAIKGENDFILVTKTLIDVVGVLLVDSLILSSSNILKLKTAVIEATATMAAAKTAALEVGLALKSMVGPAVLTGLASVISYTWELGKARRAILDATNEDTKALQKNAAARELYTPLETLAEEDPAVIKARKQLQSLQTIEAERKKLEQQRASKFTVSVLEEGSNETKAVLMDMKDAAKYMEDKLTAQKKIIDATIETAKVGVAATRELTKKKIGLDIGDPTYMATLEVKKLRSQADLFDSLAAKAKASKDYTEAARQETLARDTEFQAKSAQLRLDTKDELAKAKNDLELATKAKKDAEKNIAAGVDVIESTKLKQDAEEAIKEKSKAVDLVNNAIKNIEEKNAADLATYKASLTKSQQADDKKAAAERLKTTKEEINVAKQYQATAANEAENQLKLLKGENDAKIYSFEEFVRRKKALLTEDFQNQETYYNQEIALATKTGKKDLIAQYTEKLKQAKTTYETQVGTAETKGIIDNEAKQNIDAYNTNLNMIHERYQDILGIERDSNTITSAKLELIRQQLMLESTEKGEVGEIAKQRLIELEVLKEAQNLKAKMAIYDKESATAEKIHTDAISRINQLEQVGQVSSLSATMARTKANERLLEIRQKDVDLAKKALDEAKPEARPASQASYDLAKQKLESLKLVADETGAMIEQSLGNAFDKSFQGLITNTMTAKQAFKSFATSIVEDIARIIAQEVRSAILKPILRMGLSSLGGLFSSAMPSTEAAPTLLAAANGGVFSGAGISAHSGTVVSTPTIFPFAKGGGLMGEAGPEAILPLKRNSQGKLGVSVDNTGQPRGSNIYYINTTVNAKSDASPTDIANKASEAIIRAIAKQEINSAARPGNRLNQVTKYG